MEILEYLLVYGIVQFLFVYVVYLYAKNNLETKPYLWALLSLVIPWIIVYIWLYVRKKKMLSL